MNIDSLTNLSTFNWFYDKTKQLDSLAKQYGLPSLFGIFDSIFSSLKNEEDLQIFEPANSGESEQTDFVAYTAPGILFAKRPLKVEQIHINAENKKMLHKITETWRTTALHKARQAQGSDRLQFDNSASLAEWIDEEIDEKGQDPELRVFLCRDIEFNAPQAIAITSDINNKNKPSLHLNYIATNPINIRSIVNATENHRLAGAGTAMIYHLAQVCLQENKHKITLTALDEAKTFYEKIGFKESRNTYCAFTMRKATFHTLKNPNA